MPIGSNIIVTIKIINKPFRISPFINPIFKFLDEQKNSSLCKTEGNEL